MCNVDAINTSLKDTQKKQVLPAFTREGKSIFIRSFLQARTVNEGGRGRDWFNCVY